MRQIDRSTGWATMFSTLAIAAPIVERTARSRRAVAPRRRGSGLRRGLEAIRLWRERVRGRSQLLELDDHLLRDIGMTRLQAEVEAHKPFWRA